MHVWSCATVTTAQFPNVSITQNKSQKPVQTTNFAWARRAAKLSRFCLNKVSNGNFDSPAKYAWITGSVVHFLCKISDLFPFFKSLLANLPFWKFIAACQSFHSISDNPNLEKQNKQQIQIWLI